VKVKTLGIATAAVVALSASAMAQAPRDNIWSVGSSTVFPYSQAVAEEFSSMGHPSPSIESTGSGGGFRIFCQGVGLDTPDISRASRAMKESEWDTCNSNGVTDITEVQVGYDGISLAMSRSAQEFDVSREQLYLALAADVPVNGEIVPNPYEKWSDIDPSLPDEDIIVYGPPPTSGTRDAWVELVMEHGCAQFPEIEALEETDEDRAKEVCQRMRTDGPFIEAGENDNLIVQQLETNTGALGIFGYSYVFENMDALQAATIEGVGPNQDTIADASYPVARPLFIYIKNAHRGVTPGLNEYIDLYTQDDTWGPDGYLVERGLVPLSDTLRAQERAEAMNGTGMTRFTSN